MLAFASSPLSFSAPALARPAAALRGAASMGLAPPVEKSQALPFAERPAKLDGTLVGDVGARTPPPSGEAGAAAAHAGLRAPQALTRSGSPTFCPSSGCARRS